MHQQVLIVGDDSQLEKVHQQLARQHVHHGQLAGATLLGMRFREVGVGNHPQTADLVMAVRPYFCNFGLQVHHRRGRQDGQRLPYGVWLQPIVLPDGLLQRNGDQYFDVHNVVIAPNGANRIYATPFTQIVLQGQPVEALGQEIWQTLEFPDPNAPLPGQPDNRFSLTAPSTWFTRRDRQLA